MKVRYKNSGIESESQNFNTTALWEALTGDDSVSISELDVLLNSGEWKDMDQAFKDHDLITNNFNTCFFEPTNEEDKVRGFSM